MKNYLRIVLPGHRPDSLWRGSNAIWELTDVKREAKMPRSLFFRASKLVIVFILLIGFFGCTRHYVPKQYPLKPGMAPDFTGSQAITIVNAQTSPGKAGKEELLGSVGAVTWMGDLQKWTDTAVRLLKTELEKRGFNVTENAPKKLRLTVTRANIYTGFMAIRSILYLKVETGKGYTKEFEGNNRSPWTLYRAADGAVTRAVGAMLNDDKILSYLKE